MTLLAIETATESCSVALLHGERVCMRSEWAPRRHASLLLPMCDAVLAEAGLSRRALQSIAVGCGPGAFTGVRLAISAAQGIAFALGLRVVPVSSLAALALQGPDDGAPVLALIDARMGEVYAGWYAHTADGEVAPLAPEWVGPPEQLPTIDADAVHVVGSGWGPYADVVATRLGRMPRSADAGRFPQAVEVARLALGRDGVEPDQALPVYLRDKVALTLTEQRARG